MGVVLLVRHGQASFGADDYDVLSPTGWEQSRRLGAWLRARDLRPDVLVHGGLRRQRETAEALASSGGWDVPVETDAGWAEFDHLGVVAAYPGLAGGVTDAGALDRREFQRVFEAATARWTAGEHDHEYAEPFVAFRHRVEAALERICAQAGSGATAVVVSSGGPIAAATGSLVAPGRADAALLWQLWGRFNTVVVNSSVTRVLVGATGPRLLTFNEHPHLAGDLLTYR